MKIPVVTKFVFVMVALAAIICAGICGAIVIGVGGFILDLNLGVASVLVTSGPERLGVLAVGTLSSAGMFGCALFGYSCLRRIFRKDRHAAVIGWGISVVILATSVLIAVSFR